MNDTVDNTAAPRRARLAWQCRRGMLELELLLQAFLDVQYDSLTFDEQRAFEGLLIYPDQILLEYAMGRLLPADPALAHVVTRLRAPAQNCTALFARPRYRRGARAHARDSGGAAARCRVVVEVSDCDRRGDTGRILVAPACEPHCRTCGAGSRAGDVAPCCCPQMASKRSRIGGCAWVCVCRPKWCDVDVQ